MWAASGEPSTSALSASSAIRSASRRLVLARRLSLITPVGRWVASTRCRPSERPRWATLTTPSTKSGTSWTRAANSSTTITRLGGVSGSPRLLQLEQVLDLLAGEQLLAVGELGAERDQRPPDQVRAEVGDQTHGVRQVDAVPERRAALVVDQQERDPLRAVRGGHGQDPGLQELALAGACGAAEQRVRPVHPQVQGVRLARCLADDGAQRAGAARSRRRGRWAGEDRAALLPAFEHDGGLLGDARVVQLEPGDGPGQVTVVVEHRAGVDQRRQRPAEGQRGAVVDGVHGDVGDGRAGDAVADAGQPGAAHVDVRGARGGQVFGPRCEPDAVDADCGPVPAELDQAGAVGGGAAVDQDEHGDQAALFGGLAVGGLAVGARPGQLFELAEQGGGLGPGHQVRAGQRTVRGGGVRQPLQPVPVGPRAGPAEGGEHDLGRGVQRGQLAQDGAGHVERGAGFPGDADRPVRGEREGERHVVDDPVPGQHLVQRGLGGRCGPAAGLDGEAQLRVQRRSPHPHVEEPRHVRPSAPQQRGPLGGGGQAARRGRMLGVAGLSLLRLGSEGRLVQRGDLAAHVGQGAAAAAGRGPAALDDVRQHDHRAQRHEDQRRGAAGDRVQDAAEQERGEHGQDRETLVVERLRELRAGERRPA